MRGDRLLKGWLRLGTTVLALLPAAAQAQYVYGGPIISDVSGVSCRPTIENGEESVAFREITSGLSTKTKFGGFYFYTCPIARRNTTIYGTTSVANEDRVLMSTLRVSVSDGSATDVLFCTGYLASSTGSLRYSSTKWACGNPGGCPSAVPGSFTAASEFAWTNPFGASAIVNQGAVNMGYSCAVPSGSNILWARASFGSN